MASELEEAIVEVKRQLGVTTAPANEIAIRLPEHLRSAFWEQAVEYYFADQMALLDAVEEAGFIAAAEARGYQKAIDALRKREHGSVIPDYRDEARRAADYLEGSR